MVRRDKNKRSSNSEAAGESPRQQSPNASSARGRNNFFDDFETFYYTGRYADDSSLENGFFDDRLTNDGYPEDSYYEDNFYEDDHYAVQAPPPLYEEESIDLMDSDDEDAYRPLSEESDPSSIRVEEEASTPGIRRVVIPIIAEPELEEPEEELELDEFSDDEAVEAEEVEPKDVETTVAIEPISAVTQEHELIEQPVIRRIAAPELVEQIVSEPVIDETIVGFVIQEPEEDEAQYTEHIRIVPSIEKAAVHEGKPPEKTEEELDKTDVEADEDVEPADTESRDIDDEPVSQFTERIYFPAGFTSDERPVAEQGVVQEGAFVPKAKTEDEDKEELEDTDAIEIRRVLSLAEALVLEQSLRAQNPLADLTTTEIETILIDEIDEDEKQEGEEDGAPWHARIPVALELQESLNRAGEALRPTKDNLDRWMGRPFRPRPLPDNFDTLIDARKRSLLQEGRLEAETSGLFLTSAIAYAMLWLIWLLLPADFLGIMKNQVSGQLVYLLLQAGLVLLVPLMLFAKYHPFPLSRIFGPVMPSGSQNLTAALIGIPLGVLVISLQNLSSSLIPDIYSSNLNRFMFMPQSLRPGSTIILWVVHIILPSFLEEVFFRGNLFTGLMRQGHRRAAFILPSLLYALLFKDPLIFIPFLVGMALSWVRYRCASLFGSMITHFSFAATIFFLYQNVPAFVRTMPLSSTAGQASLYASVVATVVSSVTLVSLLAFVGTLQTPEQTSEFSQSRTARRSLVQLRGLRIGVLVYILIYLLNLGLF